MLATTRSIRIHRAAWATLAIVPFVVAACGGDTAKANPVTSSKVSDIRAVQPPAAPKGGTTGPVASTRATGATSGVDVTMPATYENADDVFKAGHYPEAATMFEKYVAANPNNAYGFYMLGLSSWKAGDFERAKEAFDKSIDINPAFAKSYFNQGRVLLDLKRAPEALEQIEKGLGIDSASTDGWRLKARAQASTGDLDGAMQTYRTLLVRNDEDIWGLNNLGILMLDSGDFEGSLGPLARAVQLKPTSPLFQNNFGMALERSGYPVAALHHYSEAVRDDSSYTKAVKNVERLRGTVTDSTAKDEVTVDDLAEAFRVKVKTWKESVTPAGAKQMTVKPLVAKPDSQTVKRDRTEVPPTIGDPIKVQPDSGATR